MDLKEPAREKAGLQKSWKGLPFSLKVVFIFIALNAVFTALVIGRVPYTLLTVTLEGTHAIIASGILNIFSAAVLLIAFLKRYNWGGKFALAYVGFFLLNSAISLLTFLLSQQDSKCDGYILTPLVIGVLVNALLLALVVKEIKYFKLENG